MEVNKCFVTLLPWLGVKEWRFIHEPSRLHYMDSFIELLGKSCGACGGIALAPCF
ncbi:hypothetical protein PVAP13_6NG371600 [Panicum virgatum]|uniref:Uncharacterized protein n=1 Tax=Panicum virgatum TaxID=38727 RepID=A0A8T0R6H7_PANVG|nr:hypothetical protein PVAP13_6NG371600 [Panicum virgatum]